MQKEKTPRVLRAVQTVLDEGLAKPVLVGRPEVIKARIERLGLDIFSKIEICNPEDDPRYRDYYEHYYQLTARQGVSIDNAKRHVRTENRVIALLMLKRGEVDGCICGVEGRIVRTFQMVKDIIGLQPGIESLSAAMMLLLSKGAYFITDTHVLENPTKDQLFHIVRLAVSEIEKFGITPKVGLISHSNFGARHSESAEKMAQTTLKLKEAFPHMAVEGEMQADLALRPLLRSELYPHMALKGEEVNLMVMPNIEAANIAYNAVRCLTDATTVGPLLLGASLPVSVVTTTTTVRNLVNMTAFISSGTSVQG